MNSVPAVWRRLFGGGSELKPSGSAPMAAARYLIFISNAAGYMTCVIV